MKDNELKHLGNILANLPDSELHTVLEQMKHVRGYDNSFRYQKEEGISMLMNELETALRIDCYDYTGEPNLEYYQQKVEENPTIYPEIPHVVRLTKKEIDVFNWYLEDAKMDIAFGNSDWNGIYRKIVGDRSSEYAESLMTRYNEFTR